MASRNQAELGGDWCVEPIREEHARDILRWRYPSPYDFYNPPAGGDHEGYVSEFLRPELGFHAVIAANGEFVGFCSYGRDGQVPGGDYRESALDIGLGMKPRFTGQGYGRRFFGAILDFANRNLAPGQFRLTVANFNQRAFKLYRDFGFVPYDEFVEVRTGVAYTILIRKN